jgi:hypothetical protein
VAAQQVRRLTDRGLRAGRDDRVGHHVGHAEAGAAVAVGGGAAPEITVRHDADHVAPVEHEQVSDAVGSHGVSGLGGAGLRANRLDVAGHDVVESHAQIDVQVRGQA